MKIDLYQIYRRFHFTSFVYPIVLNVLKFWTESLDWEIRIFTCTEDQVNLSTDSDVVGISVYTQTARASYRVCDALRKKNKIVILGGPHFRGPATCEEAEPHCDVLVHSICEDQWETLLMDIAEGKILPGQDGTRYIVDEEKRFRYPDSFFESSRNLKWYQVPSIPTSLGCPYDCSFCSPYLQGKYILRDIETIQNEVSLVKGKVLFLCDASFGLNRAFTIELMKKLAPFEKKIGVETTLSRVHDAEILDAMALAGVKWIMVGIETPSMMLSKHGTVHPENNLRSVVDQIHDRGMFIQGNLICGLDSDGIESFDRMDRLCRNSNLDSIMVDILTPYPNTRLYHELKSQGRIFDTNWEHYDYRHVVYRPLRMTVDELIDGYLQLYESIADHKFSFKELLQVYKDNGINTESSVVVANKLYFKFDSKRKKKALRQNQSYLNSIELSK